MLVLITTLYIPLGAAQKVQENPEQISKSANAQLLLQQGIELYNTKQFSRAIALWQQATEAFELQKDRLNQALVWRYLSLAYQHLGQWQEAESAIGESLKLLEQQKNINNNPTYLDVLAKTLNTQGRLQWAKRQLNAALETWKKAAFIYEKAGNQTGVIGSLINCAQALQALGLSNQAAAELTKVEKILMQHPNSEIKATGFQNLGEVLRRIGSLKKSQEVLQKSWEIAKEFKLSESGALLELANTERALGNRAIAIGKEEDDRRHTQAAINFYQKAATSPTLQLPAEINLLSLFIEMGKWTEAVEISTKIKQLTASLPPSQTTIFAQLNYARSLTCLIPNIEPESLSCMRRDRQEKLRENLPKQSIINSPASLSEIAEIIVTAIQQSKSLKDRKAESYALGQLGEIYELNQQWLEAQNLTQQALLLAEEIQAPEIRYRWEWQLGRLWEKQGDRKKAISAYREAVKTLKSVRDDLLIIDSDVQFSFRDNIEPIHRKLVDLLLRKEGKVEPSQTDIKEAIEVIDFLQVAELENYLSCNLSQRTQLNQAVNRDRKAAFIYPIILPDRLEVISNIPGQNLQHHVTVVKQAEVEKTAIKLRTNLLKRNRPEEVIKNSIQLYEWLIKPWEQDLEKSREVETLVFVLDGVLRNIPMSVLYDEKRQEYLMQKPYALALVPGLQLFDFRPLQREKLEVLTAGISERREVEQRNFDELPNVEEELQQIRKIVPSALLLNPKFTETNLQQEINSGTFSAVHIATHGNFSSDPEETFILTYNQLLTSNELNNLLRVNNQNRVELLVLSACETAQGDNRATLGLAGVAVRAGARSVLSTLWQVSDRSTAELMVQFYKELTNPKLTKAQALHQAQLALFQKYKAPYYWAPYVLVGNWL